MNNMLAGTQRGQFNKQLHHSCVEYVGKKKKIHTWFAEFRC